MMRICALGNSHLAALVLGWKIIQNEYPDTKITFFGAPGRRMHNLVVSNGSLIPTTDELKDYFLKTTRKGKISSGYNCFFICGLLFSPARTRVLAQSYRAETFKYDRRIPVSDACFLSSVEGSFYKTLAVKLLNKVRQISSAPALLIPTPFSSDDSPQPGSSSGDERYREETLVAALYELACARLERGLNVQIMRQPEFTKSSPLGTKAFYTRGSTGFRSSFAKEHKDDDLHHMNAEFGAIMLRHTLSRLALENRSSEAIPNIAPLQEGQKGFAQAS